MPLSIYIPSAMPTPEEWHEADMLAEELTGKSKQYASVDEALTDLRKRLDYLNRRRSHLLSGHVETDTDATEDALRALDHDIADTKTKLADFELQRQSKN